MQKKNTLLGSLLLITTALIWGLAFAAQSTATSHMNAIAFNGIRFVFATLSLIPIVIIFDLINRKRNKKTKWTKETILGGALCGFILFIGNNLQQYGIESTSVGKASFITALYIVLVPIFALLTRRRTNFMGKLAVVIALAGFWTLSITDDFSISQGDLMVFLCSIIFSFHILFIDIYAQSCDAIKLTLMQFLTASILSIPAMAIKGFPTGESIVNCMGVLLYVGILSSGVAFTFQTAGQKHTHPAIATLLLSLESVFGFFGGVIILHESSSMKELVGCLLIFVAVFLAEQVSYHKYLEFNRSFEINKLKKHKMNIGELYGEY